jgi:predicted deacylase
MSGNLIASPCVNMSSFEFGDRHTLWDNKDLNRQRDGNPDGTITERMAHRLFYDIVKKGDAYVDIHSSSSIRLVWYSIYLDLEGADPEVVRQSKEMALAFGLEQIFGKTPWKGTFKEEAIRQGIPSMTPEIGGGADFFQNGRKHIDWCARGIVNVMKLMEILPGEIETESDQATIWNGHTEIKNDGQGALMLLDAQRGQHMKEGDLFATKYDPTTGDVMGRFYAPGEGTILNTGLCWPLIAPGDFLGVLGSVMEEVDLKDREWKF